MVSDGTRAWRRLGVFVAIALTVALGEWRPANSRDMTVPSELAAQPDFAGADEDGPSPVSATDEVTEDAQLVPAIYAWDPDVRFVYFRQVSKWM